MKLTIFAGSGQIGIKVLLLLLCEDWAGREAGILRCMVMHALTLCRRAASSRSKKVSFLKQFVGQVLTPGLQGNAYLLEFAGVLVQVNIIRLHKPC